MTDYVKSTNFTSKDSLPSGNALKIIKGTEFDVEFNNIVTAIGTKADIISPTFTGTPLAPTATAGTNTTQLATTAFVTAADTVAVAASATAAAAAYPTKSGSGATGTWDINITGNAATATTATTAANGGVTSVNGSTGAITIPLVPASIDSVGAILVCVRAVVISSGQDTLGTVGETIAGSSLRYGFTMSGITRNDLDGVAGATLNSAYSAGGIALSGTWRLISRDRRVDVDGSTGFHYPGLWQRIS